MAKGRGLIAIVGRPNVGKSTLFNRLTSSQRAIVDDQPGVTRDRIYGVVEASDERLGSYTVIDTGGFESKGHVFQPFGENLVWQQTEYAIDEATVVLFVVDAKVGKHPHDEEIFRLLKKKNKPVVLVVNKIDGSEQKQLAFEFYAWGLKHMQTISAAHNRNVHEVRDVIEKLLLESAGKLSDSTIPDQEVTKIAIVGKPNVGKSSILNRLLGSSRSVVSDVAGTTRDVVDTPLMYNKKNYLLLDTAGIRRHAKIGDKLESLSVLKSLRAIDDADVVVLVIDAESGFNDQDARLCSLALAKYKPVLIVVNKWDLVQEKTTHTADEYRDAIRRKIKQFAYVPMMFVSSLHNLRVFGILKEVEKLAEIYRKRIPTSQLNEILAQVVDEHTPALIRNYSKRIKFYYATQVRASPPTFVVKCNVADDIQESYKRYILNRFRDDLGFKSIPLQLIFRDKTASADAD